MVTMTDLKKRMRKVQAEYNRYLKSDEADPNANPSMKFVIEVYDSDGGMNAFLNDKAENWYIAYVDPYDDMGQCYISLARYIDAD